MIRFFRVLTAIALFAALGMGMGMGVSAQENATENTSAIENVTDDLPDAEEVTNDTDDQLEENESEAVPDTLAHQETIRFNNDTRIVGWEFSGGAAHVAIETDRRAGVTMSDALAGIGEKGAVQVPETRQFLERDETTIVTMDVAEFNGGHAVGVTVDGMTVRLSTEMRNDNPLRYFGGETGLITGMVLSVAMSGAAAVFVIYREEKGVIEA